MFFNVHRQDGEYFFSLESLKVLQHLMDSRSVTQQQNPRLVKTSSAAVCGNPTLPQEFIELCHQSGSSLVFSRLAAVPVDVCEICAFAACTGC
ncbi:hypothetical protein QTP70_018631 [Hemibagrus guttatus]|uniref:Guanylate cyclase activator 2B n=1 Tax=Hemibagrus guttatus TaxID=175788 RepID=A0AAE0Q2Z2_9TELE|nr:hypothetical protein QTP70_018631 [Hemibagrus guttatus]KAK3536629.1 hypothetical protein QTP86_015430 [Hemibagrus guttatus]